MISCSIVVLALLHLGLDRLLLPPGDDLIVRAEVDLGPGPEHSVPRRGPRHLHRAVTRHRAHLRLGSHALLLLPPVKEKIFSIKKNILYNVEKYF